MVKCNILCRKKGGNKMSYEKIDIKQGIKLQKGDGSTAYNSKKES